MIYDKAICSCIHFLSDCNSDKIILNNPESSVFFIDGGLVDGKKSFMESIKHAMMFPEYFGHNWDALDECLVDLRSWLDIKSGVLLIVDNSDLFIKRGPLLVGRFIECWLYAAEEWRKEGVFFHLIFTGMQPLKE